MMLLGLQSVIDADELQIGKFYLRTTHNGDSILFQCVVVGEDEEGNDRLAALSFVIAHLPGLQARLQARAKRPSVSSRMASMADLPWMRAVPVMDR